MRDAPNSLLTWLLGFCTAFLIAAAWRWGGLKQGDLPLFAIAGLLLLPGCFFVNGWKPLLRDPFFGWGFLFLVYLFIQWANAGRPLSWDPLTHHWIHQPPPFPNLPSSFSRPDAVQMLYWFLPSWTLALCIRSPNLSVPLLQRMMTILVFTAALLALSGILETVSGNPNLFWPMPPKALSFASFGYANHAAAYFLLASGLSGGLLFRTLFGNQGQRSLPRVILLTFSLLLCISGTFLSVSRAGFLLAGLLLILLGLLALHRIRNHFRPRAGVDALLSVLLGICLLYFVVRGVGGSLIREEFTPRRPPLHQLLPGMDHLNLDLADRPLLWRMAWTIFREAPLYGTGGWGFRHRILFQLPPENWNYLRDIPGRANVHNDPLQFLVEFGLLGGSLLSAALISLLLPLSGRHCVHGSLFILTSAGLILVSVFSLIDLPFRCPALLWTWTAVLAALPRLSARHNFRSLSPATP